MKNYIAAGFDPARFWSITPRLFMTEMEGAAMRSKIRRSEIWSGAALARAGKFPSLKDFLGDDEPGRGSRRNELARCVEAWAKFNRALMARRR